MAHLINPPCRLGSWLASRLLHRFTLKTPPIEQPPVGVVKLITFISCLQIAFGPALRNLSRSGRQIGVFLHCPCHAVARGRHGRPRMIMLRGRVLSNSRCRRSISQDHAPQRRAHVANPWISCSYASRAEVNFRRNSRNLGPGQRGVHMRARTRKICFFLLGGAPDRASGSFLEVMEPGILATLVANSLGCNVCSPSIMDKLPRCTFQTTLP